MKKQWIHLLMLVVFILVFIWSSIKPYQLGTWFFEVSPALFLVLILLLTYRRFPLSMLTYIIIFIGTLIMLIGGHYTYAKVPLFEPIQSLFHFSRNHFDRLGHLFQGMIFAALFHEYLLRRAIIKKKGWLSFVFVSISFALCSAYELFEFIIGFLFTKNIQDFLGTQGDIFDTHWDMIWALVGALIVLLLSPWHTKEIKNLQQ